MTPKEVRKHLKELPLGDPALAECFECKNLEENDIYENYSEGYVCFHADINWATERCTNFKSKSCSGFDNECCCFECVKRRGQKNKEELT